MSKDLDLDIDRKQIEEIIYRRSFKGFILLIIVICVTDEDLEKAKCLIDLLLTLNRKE